MSPLQRRPAPRANGRFVRVAAVAVAALVLPCLNPPAALARAPRGPYRLLSGPYDKKARPDGPAAGRLSVAGLSVTVEPLEPEARAAFIHTINPKAADPFAVAPGQPDRFHAFRVEFINASARDVTFQPGNVVMISDTKDQQFPIDLTDLYRFASTRAEDDPAGDPVFDPQSVIDRAAPYIFDLSTTIRPGERLARLLVFGPPPERFREIRLHFSFVQIGAKTHTLTFPFHRQSIPG